MAGRGLWKRGVAWASVLLCACVWTGLAEDGDYYPHCQILDDKPETVYDVRVGVVSSEDVDHGEDIGLLTVGGSWNAAFFYTAYGDVDLSLLYDGKWVLDGDESDVPEKLGRFVVDLKLTHRFQSGYGLQFGARPGFYTDMDEFSGSALFIPMSLAMIRAYSPSLSGKLGFEVRPGFHNDVIPHVGVAWEAAERWRVEAMVPSSRITYSINREWAAFAAVTWENDDYELDGDPRGQMSFEDIHLGVGVRHLLLDQLQFIMEVGTVAGRNLKFEHEPHDRNIDDGVFFRASLGGTF